MANLKALPDDVQVYLSFTYSDLLSVNSRQQKLRELLERKLGEDEVSQVAFATETSPEAIYRIALPAVRTHTLMKSFFESLSFVLKITSDLKPHFTQPIKENS